VDKSRKEKEEPEKAEQTHPFLCLQEVIHNQEICDGIKASKLLPGSFLSA
jgi:hypothetical protein